MDHTNWHARPRPSPLLQTATSQTTNVAAQPSNCPERETVCLLLLLLLLAHIYILCRLVGMTVMKMDGIA